MRHQIRTNEVLRAAVYPVLGVLAVLAILLLAPQPSEAQGGTPEATPAGYSQCDPVNAPELCLPGDDNRDGVIDEDESGWDCRTMGNRLCGPENAQGVLPGDYSLGVWLPHPSVPLEAPEDLGPEDLTVCREVNGEWVSAATPTLGLPCAWER